MIRSLAALGAFAFLAACGGSDPAPATPPAGTADTGAPSLLMPLPSQTTPAISGAEIAARIAALSDDTFEGRAPGSETGEAAAEWIAAEMARIGLQPGVGDSYLQPVGMVEMTLGEAVSGIGFANGDEQIDIELGPDAVIWSKRQTEETLGFEASEMVFVGYGVVAPEYGWNDYAGLDVAGKTVVMLVNDPGFANPDGDLFKGKAMTYYGRWTYKFEEAARQGAAGAIIIHETAPASYGWDVVENSWSGAQADLIRADAGAERTVLEGWVTSAVAENLFQSAGLDFASLKAAAAAPGFTPVDMGELTATASLTQTMRTVQSHNVVGVIPGASRPDEYVLYVAHWDHLGRKASEDPAEDVIFNGAVDNATGTSAILEIAEAMQAERLERSVLFVAVTLEESGLLGSAFYAENPTVDLSQVVAGVNIDAMLPVGRTRDMTVVGFGASELEDMLVDITASQGRVIVADPTPEAGYFYRSDHVSFAKKGVPMLYADGGQEKLDGGLAAGEAFAKQYTSERYHKPADEYDSNWDMSGIAEDTTALYLLGLELARSEDWPEWYEGNEFKAIRDAARAGN